MIHSGRTTLTISIALSALLVACSQSAETPVSIANNGMAGAAASSGGSHAVGEPSGAASTSAAGSNAGAAGVQGPAPNISGRWAMFGWEDPVGVQLRQSEGSLSGVGCGAGTPPASQAALCSSDLAGSISGNLVKFDFLSTAEILPGRYLADLVASDDGTRMAGRFGIGSLNNEFWFAWLPVAGDDYWLRVPDDMPSLGGQQLALQLSTAEANDPAFAPNIVYDLRFASQGIVGSFGAFFLSEMRRDSNGSIEVGPVAPTVPELPVYLSLTKTGDAFTSVTARLANGHTFTFNVLPVL